jgi:hypothetical protein
MSECQTIFDLVDEACERVKDRLADGHLVVEWQVEGKHGWNDPDYTIADIILDLSNHISKSNAELRLGADPIDVIAFGIFWWNRVRELEPLPDSLSQSRYSPDPRQLRYVFHGGKGHEPCVPGIGSV